MTFAHVNLNRVSVCAGHHHVGVGEGIYFRLSEGRAETARCLRKRRWGSEVGAVEPQSPNEIASPCAER